MADVMYTASAWLEKQRVAYRTILVSYMRGTTTAQVHATVATSQFDLEDGTGAALRLETRDYLIAAAELVAAGITLPPRAGDTIRESLTSPIFTAVAPGRGVPTWRWYDRFRSRLRVHTTPQG